MSYAPEVVWQTCPECHGERIVPFPYGDIVNGRYEYVGTIQCGRCWTEEADGYVRKFVAVAVEPEGGAPT